MLLLSSCVPSKTILSNFLYFFSFRFFVIAVAIVAGYLVLSLPISVVTIIRPLAVAPRLLLLVLDTVLFFLNSSISWYSIYNSNVSMVASVITEYSVFFLMSTGGSGSEHRSCFRGSGYSVFGTQRESEHKLACYLPTVWRFLSENERSSCLCFCLCRLYSHSYRHLRRLSQTALSQTTTFRLFWAQEETWRRF